MSVSRIYLIEPTTEKKVEGSLFDEISDAHLTKWKETWLPAFEVHCATVREVQWPQDQHWEWYKWVTERRELLSFRTFAVECNQELQGLMMTSSLGKSRLSDPPDKPTIYVELIATAPWNRSKITNPPHFRKTGEVLMEAAVRLSREEGFKGRLSLHSLDGAEDFYRDKCGMTDLGKDDNKDMVYFEMTEKQAEAFLKKRAKS